MSAMEFHVVESQPCAVHEVENNFRLIKSAVSRLRQDMIDAEMDFHRRPLSDDADAAEGGAGKPRGGGAASGGAAKAGGDVDSLSKSSVHMLDSCVHEWSPGRVMRRPRNRIAEGYYAARKKVGTPNIKAYADAAAATAASAAAAIDGFAPARPRVPPAQQRFAQGLSPMWSSGSNPPQLGPASYGDAVLASKALRTREPGRESATFSSALAAGMSLEQMVAAGDDHATMRPRVSVTASGCRGDDAHLDAGATTAATLAPRRAFPESFPDLPSSPAHHFSPMPRMPRDDGADGALARLRPALGARGPGNNLGSTYTQDWDERAWARTAHPMSRAARAPPIQAKVGGGDPGATEVDQGSKTSLRSAVERSRSGRLKGQGRSWAWQVPRDERPWETRPGQNSLGAYSFGRPTAARGGQSLSCAHLAGT